MAESRASIEERLALLVQEPNKKSICDRIPVRIFVVFMWIGFAVSMGISGYYITRWLKERSNYDSYKYKLIHVKEDIIHAQREQTTLEKDIKQAQKEVAVIKGNIDKYRKENSALSEEIGHLKNSINYTHHAINETDEHIRSEKAEHSKLVEEDKRLTKELEDITKIYNEIMIKVNVSRRDLAIWKVGTGAGLLGSTLTALIGFRMTAELTQIQKKIKHASLIQKNFTRLSDEFGNALVRDIQAGGSITREVCYKWKSFKTPSNCNGKLNPTITIKTNMLPTLETRYSVPSRRYFTDTVTPTPLSTMRSNLKNH